MDIDVSSYSLQKKKHRKFYKTVIVTRYRISIKVMLLYITVRASIPKASAIFFRFIELQSVYAIMCFIKQILR